MLEMIDIYVLKNVVPSVNIYNNIPRKNLQQ